MNEETVKKQGTFQWDDARKRLEKAEQTLERALDVTPEQKRKILKARAASLAKEPKKEPAEDEILNVVQFVLSYENYAVESDYVREVVPLKDFTPVPCVPSFVFGIVNVRGKILSVVDIKKFFELPEKGLSDLNRIIILHSEEMEFGILADAISGVRAISVNELQPSLPTLTGIREDFLKGVTEERVVVLDAEKLLSDEKIVVHEEV